MIAISEFTKREIVKNFHYPPERVEITHLGIDTKKYRPLRNFKKPSCFEGKVILYSGTEEFSKMCPR
jgi:glycosyltransferase involved in cell wall biosynthesis